MITALETSDSDVMAAPARDVHPRCAKRAAVDFHIDNEEEFSAEVLPDERGRVRRLLRVFADLHARWPVILDGCKFHARKLEVEGVRGWSASRLKNTYYEFTSTGRKRTVNGVAEVLYEPRDWRMLVRWQKQTGTGLSGRPAFIRLWRTLVDNHQRVVTSAFRDLSALHRTGYTLDGEKVKGVVFGVSFPGYDAWPEPEPHTGLPAGWTKGNLHKHAQDKYERKAARVGVTAASQLGLKGRFTRVGLKPYQQISGDDHHFNVECLVPGQKRTVRPRCLSLHDVCSGDFVSTVMKHTWWDEDAQKLRVLTETDFMWLVIGFLTETGYRSDTGTEFLTELGMAIIRGDNQKPARPVNHPDRTDFEARIWRVTGGKVTVSRSGRFSEAAHGGQFSAPGGGNFRFKPIEQAWRMVDDRLDSLPAQVGKDRDHCPEAMDRERNYVTKLLADAGALPLERAREIKLPWLTFAELSTKVLEALAAISNEPDHEMKGWEKCGFVVKEYFDTLDQEWRALDALRTRVESLSADDARSLAEALAADKSLIRARRMTRREARLTGRDALQRVPRSALADLAGKEHAMNGGELKAVVSGELVFHRQAIDEDDLAYEAVDAEGARLAEGSRYVCYVNPLFPDWCVLYDAQGRFVSECPRRVDASRADKDAVVKEAGKVQRWHRNARAEMRERQEGAAEKWEFLKAHNEAVRSGAPVTQAEKRRERATARDVARFGDAAAQEILASSPANTGQPTDDDAQAAARELLAGI